MVYDIVLPTLLWFDLPFWLPSTWYEFPCVCSHAFASGLPAAPCPATPSHSKRTDEEAAASGSTGKWGVHIPDGYIWLEYQPKKEIKGPDNPTSQLLPIMSNKFRSGDGEGRKDKGGGRGSRSKREKTQIYRYHNYTDHTPIDTTIRHPFDAQPIPRPLQQACRAHSGGTQGCAGAAEGFARGAVPWMECEPVKPWFFTMEVL